MTNIQSGMDALNALNTEESNDKGTEFASFKSGTTYVVKALGLANLITFYSYGIFGKLNSFVAANPSKKSAKGYPVADYTPFDLAWKYHKDLSSDFSDQHGQEAGKYRAKQRFAMGFYDLSTGEPIIIDISKAQAQAIHAVLKKNEKKLGTKAFEIEKRGSGTTTQVSCTPLDVMTLAEVEERKSLGPTSPEDFDDLNDVQRENFFKAPAEFDMTLFDGLLFEVDEATQLEYLTQVGFDVANIGYAKPSADTPITEDISDDALPF